jgi:adenylate cyclase
MSETRKLAAILVADVVGYSRLAGADEDRTLARLRALRSDLIDPTIAVHHGRIVKRTGDGSLIEFRSVVDAARCAIELQNGLIERNAGVPPERRIEFRVGIHLGDVVEEADGDLMGDGVNIAARLESIAKPGGICLSEQAYWQVKGRLDVKVSDLGPTQLKNIVEPIRVYSLQVGAPTQPRPGGPKRRLSPSLIALGFAALAVLAAGVGWYLFAASRTPPLSTTVAAPVASNAAAPAEAAHLSIVVLPFANLSGDPAQDYFADGITENLTTDLSRIRNSFVIARNTAFTYKGRALDAKEIGKELGVRYVLEGSVQRDGTRVRVNAQLIDTESGAHLWADRFEEDVADLFKLQDEIVARLANTLGFELVKAEAERAARSKNPDAVDLTMRGWALARPSQQTNEKNEAARALFEQALKIDPNNADALAGIAYTYTNEYVAWGRKRDTDYDAKILGPADQAIALAPDTLWAYYVKCVYLCYSHRADKAIDAADAGLAINPNFGSLWAVRGNANLFSGRFEQARSDLLQSMRLSPREPLMAIATKYLGDAELGLGHFEAAIEDYHKAIDLGMPGVWPNVSLTAAYALSGRMEEANSALAEARRLEPRVTIKFVTLFGPPIPNLLDGLRKAGLAEDAPAEPAHLSIVVLPFTRAESVQVVSRAGRSAGSYPQALK